MHGSLSFSGSRSQTITEVGLERGRTATFLKCFTRQARASLLGSSTIIICHVCINTRIEYKYINKVCIQYNLFIWCFAPLCRHNL